MKYHLVDLQLDGDKKNKFFSELNIQNITKPHVKMNYVIKAEEVQKYFPDLYNKPVIGVP